jgi:hypothetical protein
MLWVYRKSDGVPLRGGCVTRIEHDTATEDVIESNEINPEVHRVQTGIVRLATPEEREARAAELLLDQEKFAPPEIVGVLTVMLARVLGRDPTKPEVRDAVRDWRRATRRAE